MISPICITAYGADTDEYDYNIEWNISDMPLGDFTEYNGLESVGKNDLTVVDSKRTFEGKTYSKALKTNGASAFGSNYVPQKRALKFSIEKPCYIDILAYGTSSDVDDVTANISRDGELIGTINLIHNSITSHTIYLNKADTYYIYCVTGSMGFSYIHLRYKNGDINADDIVDKDDLTLLYQILYNSSDFDDVTLSHADLNTDGKTDDKDRTLLTEKIKASGGYIPSYNCEKKWTMDKYESGAVYTKETDLDGLLIMPKPSGSTSKDVCLSSGNTKSYNGYSFSNYIDTNGAAGLNNDNTAKSRAIKLYTSEPCYVFLLVRVSNTNSTDEQYLKISVKGREYNDWELIRYNEQESNELQYVSFYLDRPDEYSIYNDTGSINIYQVILSRLSNSYLTEYDRDTVWNFDDEAFDDIMFSGWHDISEETTILGLTLTPHVIARTDSGKNEILGEKVNNFVMLEKTSDFLRQKSLSFYVNGLTDIYIFAKSNDNNFSRPLKIYSESDKSEKTIRMSDKESFHIVHSGKAGKLYLYAPEDAIRIYRICIKPRNTGYYNKLPAERIWDFSDEEIQGTLDNKTYYNGLNIYATDSDNVKVGYNSVQTPEGFKYYYNVSLLGEGSSSYGSIAFEVAQDSYVYITARVPAADTERFLLVTDKYCTELDTDLPSQYIKIDDETRVYRFKYNGPGDKIFLRSIDSQIRIYQIAVKKATSKTTEDSSFNFESLNAGEKISDYNSDNYNIYSSYNSSQIVSDPIENYNNALDMYTDTSFIKSGKIGFTMPNSFSKFGNNPRLISITAKGNNNNLYIANKYGYIYKGFDTTNEPGIYSCKFMDDSEELYIYGIHKNGSTGNMRIYSVITNDTDYTDTSGDNVYSLKFDAGKTFTLHFTAENIPTLNQYLFSINYDSSLLSMGSVTLGPDLDNYSVNDCVKYSDGEATISLDNAEQKNWSGIVATANFYAKKSGSDNIRFNVYKKGGA